MTWFMSRIYLYEVSHDVKSLSGHGKCPPKHGHGICSPGRVDIFLDIINVSNDMVKVYVDIVTWALYMYNITW
jgi:hypothetical protein